MPPLSDNRPVVELLQVSRIYGSFSALRDVSLRIMPGAAVLLLGENGAGKSTMLRVIAGLIAPTSGTVSVFGDDPRQQRERLALMSHAPLLYDELTGLENLRYFAELYSGSGVRIDPERALREVGLDPNLSRRVGEYSQGMRQRASLARALMLEPDLLLLDEPFSNLDATSARQMIARLRRFLDEAGRDGMRRTLLLTTHQAELALPLATTVLTLSSGSLAIGQTRTADQPAPAANPA